MKVGMDADLSPFIFCRLGEYPLDQVRELSVHVPKPVKASRNAGATFVKSTARLFLIVGRKRYILLETQFEQNEHGRTQSNLANVTEQLAGELKVSWSQS